MKQVFIATLLLGFSVTSIAQSKEAGTDRDAIKQYVNNKNKAPSLPDRKDEEEVKAVLKKYNSAIEKLDVGGTEKLFTADSKIYESGGSEGTYAHYLEHHLAPELKEFKSFTFSDYKVDVQVGGVYAFATETYNYTITLTKDNSEVKRKGVATSVVKKVNGQWLIMISHNSSRK